MATERHSDQSTHFHMTYEAAPFRPLCDLRYYLAQYVKVQLTDLDSKYTVNVSVHPVGLTVYTGSYQPPEVT